MPWLSQEAYDRLHVELEQLRTEGRRRISETIEVARSHGDIRENAEYDAAKDEQGKLEARIRQLEQLLRDATIGEPGDHRATDTVAPGLIVTLEIEGEEETYYVAGSREDRHASHPVLSTSSPIGQAIEGAAVGSRVSVNAPVGSYEVTITRIASA